MDRDSQHLSSGVRMPEHLSRGPIVIFGASGFIGGHLGDALGSLAEIRPHTAPRFRTEAQTVAGILACAVANDQLMVLSRQLVGASVVVNAAGLGQPDAELSSELLGANALLPAVLALAAARAGVTRFVHVSSAAVQGRAVLDESERMSPLSPYAFSKGLGEAAIRELANHGYLNSMAAVRYRPTSVHGEDRATTEKLVRLARSRFAVVEEPGNAPTPQIQIGNVAHALAFLATSPELPPTVVLHPWEGLTTAGVLELLGGRAPRMLPAWVCAPLLLGVQLAATARPSLAGRSRRLEMLLKGQAQSIAWLTSVGWKPVVGRDGWRELGQSLVVKRIPAPRQGEGMPEEFLNS